MTLICQTQQPKVDTKTSGQGAKVKVKGQGHEGNSRS